jgi:hypothetical protein
MSRWKHVAIVTLIACVSGCHQQPKPDPQLDSYIAGAKSKLAKVGALKAAVAAIPRLTADTLALPAKGPSTLLSADQLRIGLGSCFEGAMVCQDDWWLLSECQRVAGYSKEQVTSWGHTGKLKACAGLRYLAVARKTAFHQPIVSVAEKKYEGGELAADVLVYEIDTGKYLGGFRAKGVTPEGFRAGERDSEESLRKDLLDFIGTDLARTIQKRIGTT